MPKQVYDEGRVVGLSAYEIYVKQALSTTPNIPVATEREWLSSTIANGASMLLKISPHSDSYKDYVLPTNSRLIAANTIIASFMYGVTASFSGDWATQITSYGKIAQAPASETTVNKNLVNTAYTDSELKTIQKKQMQYIKISDGVVYQNGKWKSSGVTSPKTIPDKSDMKSGKAVVRISFSDVITEEFYVLLTGFVDLQVAQGVSGLDTSVNTNSPQNGDFLGPATFPWMSKIWFATPGNLTYALKMGLNGGGMPNVEIINDKDSISTTIKVMNNITTEKSVAYLDLVPVDANGNKITDANKKKYAAGYKVEIDGSKLLDDTLSPGYGIDIVDSSNQNNSQGTPKKVVKTNISSTKGSGITISQPTDANKNKSGSVVQSISTNLNAGTGIQIGNKTGQEDNDTSKTIATNILVGNGLQINKLSSKDDTGSQTISHNLVNGTGVSIGTRAELGVSTTAITNNGTEAPTISGAVKPIAELKLHDTVRYDNTRFRWDGSKWLAQGKASNATTGRPTIIYSNIKSDGSISITPSSASTSGSAQTINTNLKQGTGIAVNNTNGNIQSRLTPGVGIDINPASGTTDSAQTIKSTLKDGKGTKVINNSDSTTTSGGSQQIDLNLRAGNGISVDSRDGVVTITNTLPNTSQLGGFVQLTVDDIGFIFDNSVTVYDSEMVYGNWENYLGETKAYWNYSPEEARRAFEVRPSTINTHGKYKQFNFSIRPIWDYDGIVREVLFSTSKSGHGWIENGRSRSYVYAYSRPTYLHALHAYLYNSDFSDEYGSAERKQDAINSILCGIRVRDSNKQITDPTNPDNTFDVSDLANFYVFNHTCNTSIMNGGGIGMYGVGVNHTFSMVEVSTEMHGFHYNTIFGPSSPLQCKNADFVFVLQSFSDGINGQILDYPIQVNFPRAYIENGYNFNTWKSKVESNMIYQDVNFSSTGTFRRKGT